MFINSGLEATLSTRKGRITPPLPAATKSSAFTLIELLVVVAIISILAAILFPVFSSAREKARQTSCASNLKQLGLATLQYVEDYDENWPLYMYQDGTFSKYWFGWKTGTTGTPADWDISKGLLQPYMKSTAIHKCPSWGGAHQFGDGSGYGYNWGFIGSSIYVASDPHYMDYSDYGSPATDADLQHPSTTAAFADAGYINLPAYGGKGERLETPGIDPPSQWYGDPTVDFRHIDQRIDLASNSGPVTERGWANMLFCDGHVKAYTQGQVQAQGDAFFARQ